MIKKVKVVLSHFVRSLGSEVLATSFGSQLYVRAVPISLSSSSSPTLYRVRYPSSTPKYRFVKQILVCLMQEAEVK